MHSSLDCSFVHDKAGLVAGHETTGATLSRVMPEIQKQPHIMARLRKEQAELIEQYGRDITCKSSISYHSCPMSEFFRQILPVQVLYKENILGNLTHIDLNTVQHAMKHC